MGAITSLMSSGAGSAGGIAAGSQAVSNNKPDAAIGTLTAVTDHVSSYYAGRANAYILNAKADQLAYQAESARISSNMARYEGQIKNSDSYLDYFRAAGRQAAAQAQGGILSSATGLSLRNELDSDAARNSRRALLESRIKSDGFLINSIGLMAGIQGQRDLARLAKMQGWLQPIGNTLGAFGKAFDVFSNE